MKMWVYLGGVAFKWIKGDLHWWLLMEFDEHNSGVHGRWRVLLMDEDKGGFRDAYE